MKYQIKKKITAILIISFITLMITNWNTVRADDPPIEVTNIMIISSDTTFIFDTFNIKNDIIIQSDVNVSFLGCIFNFLNTTDMNSIILESRSSVVFDHCELYGDVSNLDGNGFIDGDNRPSSIIIKNTEFINMGSLDSSNYFLRMNVFVGEETNFLLEDSIIYGKFAGMKISNLNCTIIRNNIITNPSDSVGGISIDLTNGDNVLIEKNIITGFQKGIESYLVGGNFTIFNNTIKEQSQSSIIIDNYPDTSNGLSLNISQNILKSNESESITFTSAPFATIDNNTFYSSSSSLLLQGQSGIDNNISIVNNKFIHIEPDSPAFVRCQGVLTNWTIANNSFEMDTGTEIGFIFYFGGVLNISNLITNNSNTVNGLPYYLAAFENHYSRVVNFNISTPYAGLFLFNCNGTRYNNLTIQNSCSIRIEDCNNITLTNFSITEGVEPLRVLSSTNITIQNGLIYNEYNYSQAIYTWDSSNFTLENIEIRFDNQFADFNGVNINHGNGITMRNVSILGQIFYGLTLFDVNSSKFLNNSIDTDKFAIYFFSGYNNNISFNRIKSQQQEKLLKNFRVIGVNEEHVCINNTFNYNEWYSNIYAEDSDKNGICDTPHTVYNQSTGIIIDNFPLFFDYDSDGLDDFQEDFFGSNMYLVDTDNDQIDDYDEIRVYSTNPNSIDSDGDNIDDFQEITLGLDGYITNPLEKDTDSDLFSDYEEYIAGSNPNDPTSFPGGYFGEDNTDEKGGNEGPIHNTFNLPGRIIFISFLGILSIIGVISLIKNKGSKNNFKIEKKSISRRDFK